MATPARIVAGHEYLGKEEAAGSCESLVETGGTFVAAKPGAIGRQVKRRGLGDAQIDMGGHQCGAALCEAAGIEPDARAETIDVAGFLRLADALQ